MNLNTSLKYFISGTYTWCKPGRRHRKYGLTQGIGLEGELLVGPAEGKGQLGNLRTCSNASKCNQGKNGVRWAR
ncbi:hypothetical protein BKA56DRAFT_592958 [Ilyonectria sp. MPI-CAGE-AT-0026]|nr:hypothetical protein BKA56DRAFT_592958 [Ilyonectria sp. MPI-CAGE-AT-0026]